MVLLVVFLALALAAPGESAIGRQSGATFDDLAHRAALARDGGRLDEALALYRQALRLRPGWATGWWYVGTILYDQDRYADARDTLRKLVALEPDKAPASALLGLCEFQTGEYDLSLGDLRKALALGIDDDAQIGAVTRYHAAILLSRSGEFEISFETLRRLARQNHDSENVVVAFGIAVLRKPVLPADLPADEREAVLVAGRAAYNWAARRNPAARAGFEALIVRYPKLPNVHYVFGTFLLDQDADAALEEFGKELERSSTHVPSLLQISLERIKRGQFAVGRPFAERAVSLAPNNFVARNVLGRILLEMDDVAGAIEQLEAGVRLAPGSAETHFALARAYARADRASDASRERATFKKLEAERLKAAASVAPADAEPEGGQSP
jgi:tetratricopeptide (TPR) repeat protein